jgi:hypothetical protein
MYHTVQDGGVVVLVFLCRGLYILYSKFPNYETHV